ncbi:tryptophan halogenase family protein [Amphiplicatus metriothermophilus]|uniref:Tryptophan halogenase n=1 Tax=Amphiplicatus metriothermophilus TaxID=1519374 RepID=A0A239PWU9_9PROT|nr:tryptophan halogenase family protein [Amphiplicatus metriothermophilus]MBB5518936.1 tryptophan halogenase [Amphiplicatus metriothermophilus]SNT74503.1 tryptophan halogenase [Amphiplicatus metriothermophilus]
MEGQAVKRVVIAGGGTAGWVAAAGLVSQLGPLLDIALVESEDIGTVGVGEATIPTFRGYHGLLGVDEREFMRATQATFKLGIAFENWARRGDRYIHSFGRIGKSTWMGDFHHYWLQAKAEGYGGAIGEYCFEHQAAEANRFFASEKSPINYAYHLDAGLYARFLRAFSEPKGVRRIEGKIVGVDQDGESGFIRALIMESGERIEGDLFIDCTGFRGLLIEQTLKAGYEDWRRWLATDSALAVQTASTGDIPPYTRAIARQAGWQWRIPLRHRVGNGLVYCSEHLADEDAHAELLGHLEGALLTEPKLIRYRTGRRRKVWEKNCIALGLAGGFVEPLESTSIHLIMIGVTRLIQLFPFGGVNDALAKRYNDQARNELEKIRDFIILHYKLTERDDAPFWRRCREMAIPDSLAQRIALFRENAFAWQDPDELFRVDSWVQVMLGQRLEPRGRHHMGRLLEGERLRRALDSLRRNIADAVAKLPSHQAFLESYCAPAGD